MSLQSRGRKPRSPSQSLYAPTAFRCAFNSKYPCCLLGKEGSCQRQWRCLKGFILERFLFAPSPFNIPPCHPPCNAASFNKSMWGLGASRCAEHLVSHHIKPCTGRGQKGHLSFSTSASVSHFFLAETDTAKNTHSFFQARSQGAAIPVQCKGSVPPGVGYSASEQALQICNMFKRLLMEEAEGLGRETAKSSGYHDTWIPGAHTPSCSVTGTPGCAVAQLQKDGGKHRQKPTCTTADQLPRHLLQAAGAPSSSLIS